MKIKKSFVTLEKIALQLYAYFTQECDRESLFHSIKNPKKRTQHALGLKRTTLNRWIKSNSDDSVNKVRKKRGRKTKIDSFDKDVIHRVIEKLINDRELITMRKLRQVLANDHDIDISKVSLWREVRSLGFTFKKLKGGKMYCVKQVLF